MTHVRQSYAPGSATADTPHIQNKLMQSMSYLFAALYSTSWQSFFDDFRALAGDQTTIGNVNTATTVLYLRMLGQVHDEIADQLVARSEDEKKRNQDLKDMIRHRDAVKISSSWQEILAKWRDTDLNLIEMCLRTIGRWVSWTDINLIVNQAMITTFLEMAGQQGIADPESAAGRVRDAAIDTFSEIVSKKMVPADKIELIMFLNLSEVVGQLISSPALAEFNSPNYDNDLAETVAKLVNNIVFDVVKILENNEADEQTRQRADDLIRIFTPYLLRFFADQYDEVCSSVIPSLTDLLTFLRKLQKKTGSVPAQYAAVLPPVLDAIIAKMKYDETADWGEEGEQTDEAEFQDLRRRLHVLQQTITTIDESYYIETLSRLVNGTFGRLSQGDQSLNWRELELALYEMYLFGELAIRNQGLFAKREPSSVAAQQLVAMMNSMIDSGMYRNLNERPASRVLTVRQVLRTTHILPYSCSTWRSVAGTTNFLSRTLNLYQKCWKTSSTLLTTTTLKFGHGPGTSSSDWSSTCEHSLVTSLTTSSRLLGTCSQSRPSFQTHQKTRCHLMRRINLQTLCSALNCTYLKRSDA
jgi:exportin-T